MGVINQLITGGTTLYSGYQFRNRTPIREGANRTEVSSFLNFLDLLKVLAAVDQMGFEGSYDFFYLPMNRRHRQGIGYAFINFQEKGTAALFKDAMCGYQFPGRNSKKVVHVAVAQLQGRQEVDAYFSRTQVMHTRYRPVMS
eukprot:s1587_g8.t1